MKIPIAILLSCWSLCAQEVQFDKSFAFKTATGAAAKNMQYVGCGLHSTLWAAHKYPGNQVAATNTAGNTLLVALSGVNVSDVCSDTKGNSYTLITNLFSYCQLRLYMANNIVGCTSWSSSNYITGGTGSDVGITVVEFSGVTGVDKVCIATNEMTSAAFTTTENCIFAGFWANEGAQSTFGASVSPGTPANATLILFDSGHYDKCWYWPLASGYAADTYTFTIAPPNDARNITFFVALK